MSTTFSKPAGIPVLPPHADAEGDCVVRRLLSMQPWRAALPWPDGFSAGVAHRLDISTSGALLVADDVEELIHIRSAFQRKVLVKTYRLWSNRAVGWDDNTINNAIAHAPRRRKSRMVVQRGPNTDHRGQWYPAQTDFRRINDRVWRATMRTGVMHQIRVHAAFIGIPLAGDSKYGGGERPPQAPSDASFLLHHVGLNGEGVRTEAVPLPDWAAP